jgi:hypothetical protein
MFGFSLTKLLFTVAAVLAVWYGFKWVGRMQTQRDANAKAALHAKRRRASAPHAPPPGPAAAMEAEEMIKCPACGDYVSASAAVHCGRKDCPYPG